MNTHTVDFCTMTTGSSAVAVISNCTAYDIRYSYRPLSQLVQ